MRRSPAPDDAQAHVPVTSDPGSRTLDVDDARGGRRSGPHRALVAFLCTAVVGLVVVSAGSVLLSQSIAQGDALADAERETITLSEHLIAPVLTDALEGAPGR